MRPARRYGVGPLRTSSLLGTSRFRKCQFTGMILSRFRRSGTRWLVSNAPTGPCTRFLLHRNTFGLSRSGRSGQYSRSRSAAFRVSSEGHQPPRTALNNPVSDPGCSSAGWDDVVVQGRADPQREILDVESVAGHLLPAGGMFAFLAGHRRELFPDEL